MHEKPDFQPTPRKPITLPERKEVIAKQFMEFYPDAAILMMANGSPTIAKMTKAETQSWFKKHGHCYLSKKPINGQPFDFEHVVPNAIRDKRKKTIWQIALKEPHKEKSKRDQGEISRAVRLARKHGIDQDTNPIPETPEYKKIKGNSNWPSRPMGQKSKPNVKYYD